MKIIAFIERHDQVATAEKILRHCGLWTDQPPSRAPPPVHYTAPFTSGRLGPNLPT
jgi:hypothetical protein